MVFVTERRGRLSYISCVDVWQVFNTTRRPTTSTAKHAYDPSIENHPKGLDMLALFLGVGCPSLALLACGCE